MGQDRMSALISSLVAVAGTGALLGLTLAIGQQRQENLALFFAYQGGALVVAAAVIAGIRLSKRGRLAYLAPGRFGAPARAMPLLGVRAGESWAKTGTVFAVIVSVVTAGYLYSSGPVALAAPLSAWALAAFIAVPLSLSNAFVEEVVTRWTLAEGLTGDLARAAPWASATLFGAVHYFGIPGGVPGVLMSGFVGWLLTRSIQDTGGIGWAILIHFVLDMLIFTVSLASFIRP